MPKRYYVTVIEDGIEIVVYTRANLDRWQDRDQNVAPITTDAMIEKIRLVVSVKAPPTPEERAKHVIDSSPYRDDYYAKQVTAAIAVAIENAIEADRAARQ